MLQVVGEEEYDYEKPRFPFIFLFSSFSWSATQTKDFHPVLFKVSILLKGGEQKECHLLFCMSNEISQIFVVMKGQISNCVCRK